jgi:hypothetical protein
MRDGFVGLVALPADRYHHLLSVVTESVGGRAGARPDEVANTLGVDIERVGSLLSAGSLVVVTLGLRDSAATEFVQALAATGLASPADAEKLLPFCELVVSQRVGVRQLLTRSQLGAVVLPVLTDFDATVDIRLGFEDGQIAAALPVAVVHMDTDSTGQEVWFQINQRQLERLIKTLNNALKEIQEAERWIDSKPERKG